MSQPATVFHVLLVFIEVAIIGVVILIQLARMEK
jgi:hypothetical protein